jgi:hypothetical protein
MRSVPEHDAPTWRKARASASANCVEVTLLPDGRVGVRDSKDPHGGMLMFGHADFDAWVAGAKRGDYDHLLRA